MEVEEKAVCSLLGPVAGTHVLDLACGTGRYALLLRARGAWVAGTDLSFEMLSSAIAFPRAQADLAVLPFPANHFDLVICGLAIGHAANLHSAVAEMARILKPGGTAIYSDLYPHARTWGWQRSFRAVDGREYAVSFFTHQLDAHTEAARDAALVVDAVLEPPVDAEIAGRSPSAARFRAEWGDTPVALVFRALKQA